MDPHSARPRYLPITRVGEVSARMSTGSLGLVVCVSRGSARDSASARVLQCVWGVAGIAPLALPIVKYCKELYKAL